MNKGLKYVALLLLLFLTLFFASLIANFKFDLNFRFLDLFNITISFAITSLITILIYFRGLFKESQDQALHTFTAVGVKFIAELFIALVWFVLAKKTSPSCIILFFVLYLAFSMYLILVILNTLKSKSL